MIDPEKLYDQYLDGELDESGMEKLKRHLLEDQRHVDEFVLRSAMDQYCREIVHSENKSESMLELEDFWAGLESASSGESDADVLVDISEDIKQRDLMRRMSMVGHEQAAPPALDHDRENFVLPKFAIWVVAAAVIVISVMAVINNSPDPYTPIRMAKTVMPQMPAKILRSFEAVAGEEQNQFIVGHSLFSKRYELKSGLLELEMKKTGVIVLLEGPCVFKIYNDNGVKLTRGKLTALVENEIAKGFYVETPYGRVTDLGTEFGVSVDKISGTQAMVFKGEVTLKNTQMVDENERGINLSQGYHSRINTEGYIDMYSTKSSDYDALAYTRVEKLNRIERSADSSYEQWLLNCDKLRMRKGLVFYYNGGLQGEHKKLVFNQANGSGDKYSHIKGNIVGAKWVPGRWGDDTALAFDNANQYVELDFPGHARSVPYYRDITMMSWVNLKRTDENNYRAIFNSNSWGVKGQVHFQISPQLKFSAHVSSDYGNDVRFRKFSKPISNLIEYDKWHHIAMVADRSNNRFRFYVDGQLFENITYYFEDELHFGPSRMGGWLPQLDDASQGDRSLHGKIDSMMIYDIPLSDSDVMNIYNKTKASE